MSMKAVQVAIVNDYELVVVGVAAMLEAYRGRVEVVELDSNLPVLQPVDVILYDTFGQAQGNGIDVPTLVGEHRGKVVVYSWNLQPELVQQSLAAGAAGYVSKGADAKELALAIERVHAGELVLPEGDGYSEPQAEATYPGEGSGLTVREAEIIALITQGLSNREIAERCFLSINSVKTYIRTAYRKMQVERRSQAVLWGIEHGFQPDVVRYVDRRR